MPYVDRNGAGEIVGRYASQQYEGQEFVEGEVELHRPFDQVAALKRLRDVRALILNALAGIGFDALRAADADLVDAVGDARDGLKAMPQDATLLAATSDAAFDARAKVLYAQLVAAAPNTVKDAFRSLT